MKRTNDWQEILGAWVEKAQRTPFQWGQFDCALMAADAVQSMTGRDPAETFRGRYDDADSASQEIAAQGFDGYEDMGDALLGPVVPNDEARVGDISLLNIKPYGHTFAVDMGTHLLVACKTGRLLPKDGLKIVKTWRIE